MGPGSVPILFAFIDQGDLDDLIKRGTGCRTFLELKVIGDPHAKTIIVHGEVRHHGKVRFTVFSPNTRVYGTIEFRAGDQVVAEHASEHHELTGCLRAIEGRHIITAAGFFPMKRSAGVNEILWTYPIKQFIIQGGFERIVQMKSCSAQVKIVSPVSGAAI